MMLRVKSTMLTKRKSSTLKVTSTVTQISEESNTNWSAAEPVDKVSQGRL